MSLKSTFLKLAAFGALAIGSIAPASALNYRIDVTSSPVHYAYFGVDPILSLHVQGWADYVSPGVFQLGTVSGSFTSDVGNGNITSLYTEVGNTYNTILFPNASIAGGNAIVNTLAFNTDNANYPVIGTAEYIGPYWNSYTLMLDSSSGMAGPNANLFMTNAVVSAPEIDGAKLPLALLLTGLLFVIARRKRDADLAAA